MSPFQIFVQLCHSKIAALPSQKTSGPQRGGQLGPHPEGGARLETVLSRDRQAHLGTALSMDKQAHLGTVMLRDGQAHFGTVLASVTSGDLLLCISGVGGFFSNPEAGPTNQT
jgi:hypothetical protein